jgi:transcriptional regulator with XRE-family HTH domain
MLSDTLTTGLQAYEIGEKMRALRLRKKMGLVELGQHTGLSPALLSRIERGRMFPTLPTLLRVALVFSVGLDYFFGGGRKRPALGVARAADRLSFPDRPGTRRPAYRFECLDYPATERLLNAYFVRFEASGAHEAEPHRHDGAEIVYLMSGSLAVTIGNEEHVLNEGDSIYFDSSPEHSYRRIGKRTCTAVVVTTA